MSVTKFFKLCVSVFSSSNLYTVGHCSLTQVERVSLTPLAEISQCYMNAFLFAFTVRTLPFSVRRPGQLPLGRGAVLARRRSSRGVSLLPASLARGGKVLAGVGFC